MKTRLILGSALGQARSHLLRTVLADAAGKSGLQLVNDDADAELWVLVGEGAGDATLSGKTAFQGTVEDAAADPDAFLQRARAQAAPYQAVAAAPSASVTAPSSGPKRVVVVVTACPTGVAHTFMVAEAIEAEAKKRGWWVKVETRGSVGAGNAITPEEVREADLVIVAADIEVDLAKFAGKPMYRTSTGLALKKTAQTLDNAVAQAQVFQPAGQGAAAEEKKGSPGAYRHLLTGVSYMLSMVAAGGGFVSRCLSCSAFMPPTSRAPWPRR